MTSFDREPFRTLVGLRGLFGFLFLGLGFFAMWTNSFRNITTSSIIFAVAWSFVAALFVFLNIRS